MLFNLAPKRPFNTAEAAAQRRPQPISQVGAVKSTSLSAANNDKLTAPELTATMAVELLEVALIRASDNASD